MLVFEFDEKQNTSFALYVLSVRHLQLIPFPLPVWERSIAVSIRNGVREVRGAHETCGLRGHAWPSTLISIMALPRPLCNFPRDYPVQSEKICLWLQYVLPEKQFQMRMTHVIQSQWGVLLSNPREVSSTFQNLSWELPFLQSQTCARQQAWP